MKRSTKRLISILICLAMALAILPVAAFAAGTTKVYCQAPDDWTKCNAYWWGSTGTNPGWPGLAMTQDAEGIWYYEFPSDATGLIFNNGSIQTENLTVPTDNKVMYVFANSFWTTYGKVEVKTEYFVAGTASLCGVDWQPGAAQNKMSLVDGIYTITFEGIAAGTHKFKVTNGSWSQSWGKDAGEQDYVLELTEATNKVEIRFDPSVPSVDVVVNDAGHEPPPEVDHGIYYVAGDFNDWNAAAVGYQMTAADEGVYKYTMNLDANDYSLKVTDGTWDNSWGGTGAGGNYEFNVPVDGSVVTVAFTFATKEVAVSVSAPGSETFIIADGVSTFATDAEARGGSTFEFIPGADGTVTVDVSACDPGFYLDIWVDSEWVEEYYRADAQVIDVHVSKGCTYQFTISSAIVYSSTLAACKAGSVTYKITADVPAGEPNQGGGENPGEGGENSELNPQSITAFYGNYIGAGETMWFVYDNYEHMINHGSYSQILHVSADVPYSVTYRGMDVPVDEVGFVAYEMMDVTYQGKYVFSVTNNGTSEAFFSIEIKDRPDYVVSAITLVLGDNAIVPDPNFEKTLYEFTPDQVGVYTFTISEGFIGNWGTIYNPVDNTGTQDTTLQWTCTAVGQSVLIGVTGTEEADLTVTRTGDYVAPDQVEETKYENTYGFDYQLPEDPELIPIDVLDDEADVAVLDKNGFYRYGSQYGPLMVADLNDFPINLADAYLNGQLRAYILDENGNLIARYDYNDAMNEYLEAGLVPVTAELATMLKQVGSHHGWWLEGGFVFEEEAPEDAATAWMVGCSYIKGSELDPDEEGNQGGSDNEGGNNQGSDNQGSDNQGSNNQGGNNQGSNNQNGSNSNPKTTDISMAWALIAMVMAGTCLVVLKKKETFFVN